MELSFEKSKYGNFSSLLPFCQLRVRKCGSDDLRSLEKSCKAFRTPFKKAQMGGRMCHIQASLYFKTVTSNILTKWGELIGMKNSLANNSSNNLKTNYKAKWSKTWMEHVTVERGVKLKCFIAFSSNLWNFDKTNLEKNIRFGNIHKIVGEGFGGNLIGCEKVKSTSHYFHLEASALEKVVRLVLKCI